MVDPSDVCGGSQLSDYGFVLSGSVETNPKYTYTSFTLTVCFGGNTGSNLASGGSSFPTDLRDASLGGTDLIKSVLIDPATSKLNIS